MSAYKYTILTVFLCSLLACQQPVLPMFLQASQVQLSRPQIKAEEVFFTTSTRIHVGPVHPDCQVEVVYDDSLMSTEYLPVQDTLTVHKSADLHFISSGQGFLSSVPRSISLFKVSTNQASFLTTPIPTAPYHLPDPAILLDRQKGTLDFRSSSWLGYQSSDLEFELSLHENTIEGVGISVLEDQHSWIFAPRELVVTCYDSSGQLLAEAVANYVAEEQHSSSTYQYLQVAFPAISATTIKIRISNLEVIPDWHPGHGNKPWLFLDEIFIL